MAAFSPAASPARCLAGRLDPYLRRSPGAACNAASVILGRNARRPRSNFHQMHLTGRCSRATRLAQASSRRLGNLRVASHREPRARRTSGHLRRQLADPRRDRGADDPAVARLACSRGGRAGRPHDLARSLSISLPEFVTGSLLVRLLRRLHLLPPVAFGSRPSASKPTTLILPVLTLLCPSLGRRACPSGMLEVMQTEYVRAASQRPLRARCCSARAAQRAPAERPDPRPEPAIPGRRDHRHRDRLRLPGDRHAAGRRRPERDVNVVQSVAMLIAIVYVLINLLADLAVMLLVPKLRRAVTLRSLRSPSRARIDGGLAIGSSSRSASSARSSRRTRRRPRSAHAAHPSAAFPFGTDELGRDVLSRVLPAASRCSGSRSPRPRSPT